MIEKIFLQLFGRDVSWRFGRRLYALARGEKPANSIQENGESLLIDEVVKRKAGETVHFWDVGANVGEWSEYVMQMAGGSETSLKLDVFEPTPKAFASLEAMLSGPSVTVHNIALSDNDGRAKFGVVGDQAGTNSLELASFDQAIEHIEVETRRGDDLQAASKIPHIDLIKIDTEGHDFSVLRGFSKSFARGVIGIAQFEYNSRWIAAGASLRDVFTLAEGTSYKIGRVGPESIEIFDHWNPECDRFFEDNYALIHEDLLHWDIFSFTSWTQSNTLVRKSKFQETSAS